MVRGRWLGADDSGVSINLPAEPGGAGDEGVARLDRVLAGGLDELDDCGALNLLVVEHLSRNSKLDLRHRLSLLHRDCSGYVHGEIIGV